MLFHILISEKIFCKVSIIENSQFFLSVTVKTINFAKTDNWCNIKKLLILRNLEFLANSRIPKRFFLVYEVLKYHI